MYVHIYANIHDRELKPRADLDLLAEVALEAGEEDLALRGLEAVEEGGEGALVVRHGEEDQFLWISGGAGGCMDCGVVVGGGSGLVRRVSGGRSEH